MSNPVSTPHQLRKDVRGTFIEALMEPQPSLVDLIATKVDSNSDRENYAWLGEVAPLNEFVDELEYGDIQDGPDVDLDGGTSRAGYEVMNKKYTGALAFKRDDIADSKTGGQRIRIRDLAQRARRKSSALLVTALINGTSDKGYDNNEFFSATHPERGLSGGTQSNLLTGSGTSTANCSTDIGSAIAALWNFLDEGGEPLNEFFQEIWIGYPPALNKPISEAVKAGIISNTTNVQFDNQKIKLISMPRLTSTSAVDYYVGIADAEVRGLVWQDREGITLEEMGPGSETWFNLEQQAYKARMRGRAGYGRWQRLVKINNT